MKKKIIYGVVFIVLLINLIAFNHAWQFTHFAPAGTAATPRVDKLSVKQKIAVLLKGISRPKPSHTLRPQGRFESLTFSNADNLSLEAWYIKSRKAAAQKTTVILFHGYGGTKAQLLKAVDIFNSMGYHTLSVDFSGHGNSQGQQTSIGYFEALDVVAACQYVQQNYRDHRIVLYGFSMGAAAILRAISEHGIAPAAVILECPFGSMLQTVESRCRLMGLPTFPAAQLLVFWGGVQNGFWAFSHRPDEYAAKVRVPVLLFYGALDKTVSLQETQAIFAALPGQKNIKIFPQSGHVPGFSHYPSEWTQEVRQFLRKHLGFYSADFHRRRLIFFAGGDGD